MRIIKLFIVLVVLASLVILPTFQPRPVAAQGTPPTSFADGFDSPTLDPAWQVVGFTGTRVNGYSSPANHISLTDHPGHLRYYVDPMTYAFGFVNNYQTFTNVYPYDPGLELHRLFSGEHWVFDTKADYYLTYTNHRGHEVEIFFGDGGANTFEVMFGHNRDLGVTSNYMEVGLVHKTGPDRSDSTTLENFTFYEAVDGSPYNTYSYRLERDGSVLTASWSPDGATWNTVWSRDMVSQLNGLQQRLVIVGSSWLDSAGSYADYDYIRLTASDQLAPTISCGVADGEWHADDVSIACTASDGESGLANTADASFSLSTSVLADSETADAATDSRRVCDVAGNCATAGPIAGNKVDKKAPDITLTTPAAATYLLNQTIAANFACADGGSGVVDCSGTAANGSHIDTASAGARTFVVNASDNVGNASSQSVQYTVNGQSPADTPHARANVFRSAVDGWFGAGATVQFAVTTPGGTPKGGGQGTAGPEGWMNPVPCNCNIQPGDQVHVTSNLGFDAVLVPITIGAQIDAKNDLVSGQMSGETFPGTGFVWAWSDSRQQGLGQSITIDGNGRYSAPFAGSFDIMPGDQFDVWYNDAHGNQVGTTFGMPQARVNVTYDSVDGWFGAGATVEFTVSTSGGTPKGGGQGTAGPDGRLNGAGCHCDIQPGDQVHVTSNLGFDAVLVPISIDGKIDASNDLVSGQMSGGTFPRAGFVSVWSDSRHEGTGQSIATDGDGKYSAPFTGRFDIMPGDKADVWYNDANGNQVGATLFTLRFDVNYAHDWVQTHGSPGTQVMVTLVGKSSVTGLTDANGWYNTPPLQDWTPPVNDIAPGDSIKVTDGSSFTEVNPIGRITGGAIPGQDLVGGNVYAPWFAGPLAVRCEVWVDNGPPPVQTMVQPAGGSYQCDFKTVGWHLVSGQDFAVRYVQPDGSSVINVFRYVRLTASDQLAPTISCGVADGEWHADDVSIACTASDGESGLANTADASFSLSTSVLADSETADAATDSRRVCDVAGNCATAGPIAGNKVDKKAPDITLTTPAAATYLLNQTIAANFACAEAGSGVVDCSGTSANGSHIDTALAGARTFVVNASDNVGNASSQSVHYTVNYVFGGFLAPVDNPPVVNTGRAGRTYSVKWQLTDAAGTYMSALSAVTNITYKTTMCGAFNGDPTAALETTATGATVLRYDSSANQYVYKCATPRVGCYTLFLTLDSGQVFYAYFNLSK